MERAVGADGGRGPGFQEREEGGGFVLGKKWWVSEFGKEWEVGLERERERRERGGEEGELHCRGQGRGLWGDSEGLRGKR